MKDSFFEDMEILFNYSNYEEICYPIVRAYFMNAIGKLEKEDEHYLEEAYAVIANAKLGKQYER